MLKDSNSNDTGNLDFNPVLKLSVQCQFYRILAGTVATSKILLPNYCTNVVNIKGKLCNLG